MDVTLVSPNDRIVVLREADGWQPADIDVLLEFGWRYVVDGKPVLHPLYANVIEAAEAVVSRDTPRSAHALFDLRRAIDALHSGEECERQYPLQAHVIEAASELANLAAAACTEPQHFHANRDGIQQALSRAVARVRLALAEQ